MRRSASLSSTPVVSGTRVLVVTAGMGAGHQQVARELARRLSAAGAHVEVVDFLDEAGPAGARLRSTYRLLLHRAPWLYGAAMRFWARFPALMQAFVHQGAAPFERGLADALDRTRPDAVVSTYNLASSCLGRLARRAALSAPVITVVVDPGAHPYWVSPDVALHIAPTSWTAGRLRQLGAPRVAVAAPVLRPDFDAPPSTAQARARLGLPPEARVAVVTGGSWAAGRLDETLRVVRRAPGIVPVVLCGHDEPLRRRLAPVARTVGWTPDVPGYLAAADVVVDNAGGLTCWEALACGTPVVLFRPLPGHGRLNADTLVRTGCASWARTPAQLLDLLARDLPRPSRAVFGGPDAAAVISSVLVGQR